MATNAGCILILLNKGHDISIKQLRVKAHRIYKKIRTSLKKTFRLKRNQRKAVYALVTLAVVGLFIWGNNHTQHQLQALTQHSQNIAEQKQLKELQVKKLEQKLEVVQDQKADTAAKLKAKAKTEAELKREIERLKVARARKAQQSVPVASEPTPEPVTSGGASGVWAALRACESGGNYSINTGNGYYGAYQFTASTWLSVGGVGLPHLASPAEQDKRAQILQERSGWGQWPACAAKLGLL